MKYIGSDQYEGERFDLWECECGGRMTTITKPSEIRHAEPLALQWIASVNGKVYGGIIAESRGEALRLLRGAIGMNRLPLNTTIYLEE